MSDVFAPAALEVEPPPVKKSALERFGPKLRPFEEQKSDFVVSRSADLRRISALPRRTYWQDQSEALTLVFAKPPLPPGTCPSACPCQGKGFMKLRPIQAWALSEFLEQRGGIGFLGVGCGKSLTSFLLPPLMGWERSVLFVKAGLREKALHTDYPLLSRHWHLPPLHDPDSSFNTGVSGNLEVQSYEELSRDYDEYLMNRRIPDGIIFDEAQQIKNRTSGRTKKIDRFMRAYPDTEVVAMTGSPVSRSATEYGHYIHFSLKETSPLPHSATELRTWADTIDEGIPDYARPDAGAMWDFCLEGETVRDGYRRRLLETPGIVSSSDLSTGIDLQVVELPMPVIPPVIVDAFHRLRNTGEMPGGEMCTTKLDQVRHARELLLGYYLKWVWPNGKVDAEWIKKRRAYRKYIRKMSSRTHGGRWYDTEKMVKDAVARGEVECSEVEFGPDGKAIVRTGVDVCAEWLEISADRKALWGDKEPPKKIVWLSDYMLLALEDWARKNTGIVWVQNIGFMDELRLRATAGTQAPDVGASTSWSGHGCECFGAGENAIEQVSGERSIFASFAHTTGKNLQMFNRMLFSAPLENGAANEQALGREHRPNCRAWSKKTKKLEIADEVIADVFLGCRETWWCLERSRMDARYIESTMGQPQRLNKATVLATHEDIVGERCDRGDPLWAMTGHAKIDGKVGAVIGVDEEGKEIRSDTTTPILTALRNQAKEKAKENKKKTVPVELAGVVDAGDDLDESDDDLDDEDDSNYE